MMDRRRFLRRLGLAGAGVVATAAGVDLLELLVVPERRFWPGADLGNPGAYRPTTSEFARQLQLQYRQATKRWAFMTHAQLYPESPMLVRTFHG